MLQLFSFGSGSCGNCLYVRHDAEALLVDAGVGIRTVKRMVMEYGLRMDGLRGLLITHDHTDHIKAAGHLARSYRLPVYATSLVHKGMSRSYHTQAPVPPSQRCCIDPDAPFLLGGFRITPIPLPHDASENVGYAIEQGKHTLVIMTDIGHVTAQVRKYIGLADTLVIETDYDLDMLIHGPYPPQLKDRIMNGFGHLSNQQTAEVLAQHWHPRLRHICLCHLSGENNLPDLARQTIRQALADKGIEEGRDYHLHVFLRGTAVGPIEMRNEE